MDDEEEDEEENGSDPDDPFRLEPPREPDGPPLGLPLARDAKGGVLPVGFVEGTASKSRAIRDDERGGFTGRR